MKGIPTVTIATTEFIGLSKDTALGRGVADMAFVVVQHPIGGITVEQVRAKADAVFKDTFYAATKWKPVAKLTPPKPIYPAERIELTSSIEDMSRMFLAKGWSDGLPIIPPTEESVKWMLTGTDRSPDEIVAMVEPSGRKATVEKIAINAVMAGCRPEYMPVLIAAVEAITNPDFNLKGTKTTTGMDTIMLVINGPIRKQLDINSGSGAFGPGWRANATMGRAVQLIVRNIGQSIPGVTDMSIVGNQADYTFLFGENEEQNPWEPLHVELGYKREDNTVTAFTSRGPCHISNVSARNGEEMLMGIAAEMAGRQSWVTTPGPLSNEMMLMLCPENAAAIAKAGYSKDAIRKYLYKNSRLPIHMWRGSGQKTRLTDIDWDTVSPEFMVPTVEKPEKYFIMVVGGAGPHSAYSDGAKGKHVIKKIKLPANWDILVKEFGK